MYGGSQQPASAYNGYRSVVYRNDGARYGQRSSISACPSALCKEIGMVTGIVGAAGGIGGFFLSNILGSLKQMTGTYAIGFISFSCITLLAFVLVLAAGYYWRKSYGAENSPADI